MIIPTLYDFICSHLALAVNSLITFLFTFTSLCLPFPQTSTALHLQPSRFTSRSVTSFLELLTIRSPLSPCSPLAGSRRGGAYRLLPRASQGAGFVLSTLRRLGREDGDRRVRRIVRQTGQQALLGQIRHRPGAQHTGARGAQVLVVFGEPVRQPIAVRAPSLFAPPSRHRRAATAEKRA